MLTFEQFFNKAMIEHPSLYASTSFEESKFRVCDHAFNTIGSGAVDTIVSSDWQIQPVPDHLFDGSKPLYWVKDPATSKFVEIAGQKFIAGGENLGVMTFEEAMKIEGVTEDHLVETGNDEDRGRDPYPNFTKKYSLVWKNWECCDSFLNEETDSWEYSNHRSGTFSDLPEDWIDAGIWYYENCMKYFSDPEKRKGYHEYFGPESNISSYKERIELMIARGISHEQISQDYECRFDGDVLDFAIRRWENKLDAIVNFIEETLEHLKGMKMRTNHE